MSALQDSQAEKPDMPQARALPWRITSSMALTVSSKAVSGSRQWTM